jgi:flagellar basal body P-ring formation chaperone FlgA
VNWVRVAAFAMGMTFAFSLGSASDGSRVVPLRAVVEVKPGEVWLSDFLPSDAPAGLRRAAAAIEICRAPQPGSVRVLEAGQIEGRLGQRAAEFRQLLVPARVTVRAVGWPIAEESVRHAISKFLREQDGKSDLPAVSKIEWPEEFTATAEYPSLQAIGMEWDERQHSAQFRLRCSDRISCGSFMVHVPLPPEFSQQWHESLRAESAPDPQPPSPGTPGTILAERGKAATLIFDAGNVRISLRVICLERGELNQQIRVFNVQSRRVFRAEVVGVGLLRATL